jgi:hypothetical protein
VDKKQKINIKDKLLKMKAFCLKCRREIEIKYPQSVETRNGRPAIGGLCSCCGTRVFKIGKSPDAFVVRLSTQAA